MNKEVLDQVFKRYDLRGIYPKPLSQEFAYLFGRAVASHLKCKTFVVGRDHRNGSEELLKGFSSGLADQGCSVTQVGLISTDMIYFTVGKYGFDGGAMITASHNPSEFNGFKLVGKGASGISSETGLREISAFMEKEQFDDSVKKGKIAEKDVMDDYIEKVLSFVNLAKIKPLHVVVDASNGMAAKTISALEKKLPLKITPLFFDLDPNFPNHAPNPLDPKAFKQIREKVVKEKADAGALFDGDGDRMYMVDEKGKTVPARDITCLLAKVFLKKQPGSKILYTIVMSKIVPETIKELGGIPAIERVGHTFIKTRMRKDNILFGGELSGHFFFRDNYFADSGIIAFVVALQAISETGEPLSSVAKPYHKYFKIQETNSDVKDKQAKIAEIEQIYAPKAKKTSKLDGFTAYFGDWWFNVRPSGTENKLRLNLEAKTKNLMNKKTQQLLKTIRA